MGRTLGSFSAWISFEAKLDSTSYSIPFCRNIAVNKPDWPTVAERFRPIASPPLAVEEHSSVLSAVVERDASAAFSPNPTRLFQSYRVVTGIGYICENKLILFY